MKFATVFGACLGKSVQVSLPAVVSKVAMVSPELAALPWVAGCAAAAVVVPLLPVRVVLFVLPVCAAHESPAHNKTEMILFIDSLLFQCAAFYFELPAAAPIAFGSFVSGAVWPLVDFTRLGRFFCA